MRDSAASGTQKIFAVDASGPPSPSDAQTWSPSASPRIGAAWEGLRGALVHCRHEPPAGLAEALDGHLCGRNAPAGRRFLLPADYSTLLSLAAGRWVEIGTSHAELVLFGKREILEVLGGAPASLNDPSVVDGHELWIQIGSGRDGGVYLCCDATAPSYGLVTERQARGGSGGTTRMTLAAWLERQLALRGGHPSRIDGGPAGAWQARGSDEAGLRELPTTLGGMFPPGVFHENAELNTAFAQLPESALSLFGEAAIWMDDSAAICRLIMHSFAGSPCVIRVQQTEGVATLHVVELSGRNPVRSVPPPTWSAVQAWMRRLVQFPATRGTLPRGDGYQLTLEVREAQGYRAVRRAGIEAEPMVLSCVNWLLDLAR